jgi:voltage-gated potassium channel
MSPDELSRERSQLLAQIERWLEWPLIILAVVWLLLLVAELTVGLSPFGIRIGEIIWGIFILEFIVRFVVAPQKLAFLRANWLTIVALVLPAFRVLRVFRFARAIRGLRLARIVTSVNRGMATLGRSMQRRGFGYVAALTLLVLMIGAAGMYAFEKAPDGSGLRTYTESLWWTAMLLTTIGSEYWPRTPEGRALSLLLSLYALGMLGYIAASLATFFIGRDAVAGEGEVASEKMLRELRDEIVLLRDRLTQ